MGEMFPKGLKKLWDKWNIRGVIMLSLFLQTILIFFAPSRKRTAKKLFLVLIWSAYLLADWAADYAVGQISDSQEEAAEEHDKTRELLAFWSPFLLLHLGGPDTITALALEDNELWNRHLFSLVCQAFATVYVILLSTPNRLIWPTVIMLFGGVIKYVERTSALFSASLDKFKDSMLKAPDPGANYAKLMDEYAAKRDMNMPTEVIGVEDPEKGRAGNILVKPDGEDLTNLQVVQYAYKYFNIFKGLIVDLIFTNQQRDETRKFFDSLTAEEALSIIEVELSLIYESLFTKADILHHWIGSAFRVIALACLVSSLCLFTLKNEDQYEGFDVALTYALLICGIALDSVALFMFCVSDWTIATLRKLKDDPDEKDPCAWVDGVLNRILGFRTLRWKKTEDGHQVLDGNCMFRRWSEYVHAYNLISYCLKIRPKKIHPTKGRCHRFNPCSVTRKFCNWLHRTLSDLCKYKCIIVPVTFLRRQLVRLINYVLEFFGLTDLVEELRFTNSDRLTRELWTFIFNQVKYKHRFAEDPESAKSISSARGDWTLDEISSKTTEGGPNHAKLRTYVTEKDYDQSVLMWHIATELLYQSPEEEGEGEEEVTKKQEYTNREFSKILSDYMMYLLIMQPALMSAVCGIAKIRFRDTCEEAKEFFQRRHINKSRHINETRPEKENLMKEASQAILSVKTYVEPMNVKGDKSKSVLFDGSVLAQELKKLKKGKENNMWEVVSKVWVELLCFAATHCDSQEHASQVSKGGELINFVWLLMVHFGLGDQFQINRDDARAKLIVAK